MEQPITPKCPECMFWNNGCLMEVPSWANQCIEWKKKDDNITKMEKVIRAVPKMQTSEEKR